MEITIIFKSKNLENTLTRRVKIYERVQAARFRGWSLAPMVAQTIRIRNSSAMSSFLTRLWALRQGHMHRHNRRWSHLSNGYDKTFASNTAQTLKCSCNIGTSLLEGLHGTSGGEILLEGLHCYTKPTTPEEKKVRVQYTCAFDRVNQCGERDPRQQKNADTRRPDPQE